MMKLYLGTTTAYRMEQEGNALSKMVYWRAALVFAEKHATAIGLLHLYGKEKLPEEEGYIEHRVADFCIVHKEVIEGVLRILHIEEEVIQEALLNYPDEEV
jgi:hypothetical protein